MSVLIEPTALGLRVLLTAFGVSGREVAERTGLSKESLSRIVNGRQLASEETYCRIANAIREIGAERVLASRRDQGLPDHVEDASALRQVAGLISGGGRHAS